MKWLEFTRRLFGRSFRTSENFFTLHDVKDNTQNLTAEFLSLSAKNNVYYLKPKTIVKVTKVNENY